MIKKFKFTLITCLFVIHSSFSFSNEKFFNEGKKKYNEKKYEELYLIQNI